MADPTLSDISNADYTLAENTVIELIRAEYPALDLRKGTVLRDMVIRPAAAMYALDELRRTKLQQEMSLLTIEANADTVDPDAVNRILSNFNMTRSAGQRAVGTARVRVDGLRTYNIPSNFILKDVAGNTFTTVQAYTVLVTDSPSVGQLVLRPANDGTYYYFILPVVSTTTGAAANIEQGTQLDPTTSLYGFVAAEAYTDFAGGVDGESVQNVINRIPAALAHRTFTIGLLQSRSCVPSSTVLACRSRP
jgi:hypothetical protein